MLNRRHDLAPGGSIGAELIGGHSTGYATLLAQDTLQQALGRLSVAAAWRLTLQTAGVIGSKLQCPAADGLVGDENAAREQPPQPAERSRENGSTTRRHKR
jgi:hypothetical protein